MKDKKHEKWLDDLISEAADLGEVKFDAQKWKDKYLLNESRYSSSRHPKFRTHKNSWRTIMESKITKYSAAAVIALATGILLFGPFGPSKNSSIVLADVQQKLADAETMIVRGTKTFTHADNPDKVFEFNGIKGHFDLVKYASKQYGLVEEGYSDGKLVYRITLNLPKQQAFLLLPLYKKYGRFPATDGQMHLMNNLSPKGIIDLLLSSDYNKLGRSKIDGVEVEGFEFLVAEPFKELLPKAIFDIQNVQGRVWIGLKEQLPIWVEGDLTIGKSLMSMFHELNLHEVNIVEKCDVELDEEIFSTDPPEGYTELTLTDLLPLIPVEAKAGLVGLGAVPTGLIIWKRRRRKKSG
jgi:hypothetical protein